MTNKFQRLMTSKEGRRQTNDYYKQQEVLRVAWCARGFRFLRNGRLKRRESNNRFIITTIKSWKEKQKTRTPDAMKSWFYYAFFLPFFHIYYINKVIVLKNSISFFVVILCLFCFALLKCISQLQSYGIPAVINIISCSGSSNNIMARQWRSVAY